MRSQYQGSLLLLSIFVLAGCGTPPGYEQWYAEGSNQLKQGKFLQAQTSLIAALGAAAKLEQPDAKRMAVLLELAECYRKQQKFKDEELILQDILATQERMKASPDGALLLLAQNAVMQGRVAEAERILNRVRTDTKLQLCSEWFIATITLANLLVAEKNFEEAKDCLAEVPHFIDQNEAIAMKLATLQGATAGDIQKAVAGVRNTFVPMALMKRAVICQKQGKMTEANSLWTQLELEEGRVGSLTGQFSPSNISLWEPECLCAWANYLSRHKHPSDAGAVLSKLLPVCENYYGAQDEHTTFVRKCLAQQKEPPVH